MDKESFGKHYINNIFSHIGKYALLFVGIWLFTTLILGCAKAVEIQTVTEYIEVKVPIKCTLTIPQRPLKDNDTVINNYNIIQYVLKLEQTLKGCVE